MENNYRKRRIFRKEFDKRDGNGKWVKYSTKLGVKDAEGNWDNEYFTTEFHIKGGADIPNGTDILIPADGEQMSFKRKVISFPEPIYRAMQGLYQTDREGFNSLMFNLNLKLEDGKFIKTEPILAIYKYESGNGGHNQQSNTPSGWGSNVPEGWGDASKQETIVDGFQAVEADLPF